MAHSTDHEKNRRRRGVLGAFGNAQWQCSRQSTEAARYRHRYGNVPITDAYSPRAGPRGASNSSAHLPLLLPVSAAPHKKGACLIPPWPRPLNPSCQTRTTKLSRAMSQLERHCEWFPRPSGTTLCWCPTPRPTARRSRRRSQISSTCCTPAATVTFRVSGLAQRHTPRG